MSRSCPRCNCTDAWGGYNNLGRTDNGFVKGPYYGNYKEDKAVHTCGKCIIEMLTLADEKDFVIPASEINNYKKIWVFSERYM